jgi:hypothetical protein
MSCRKPHSLSCTEQPQRRAQQRKVVTGTVRKIDNYSSSRTGAYTVGHSGMHKTENWDVIFVVTTSTGHRAVRTKRQNRCNVMVTMTMRLVAFLATVFLCFQQGMAQECAADGTCDTHERW